MTQARPIFGPPGRPIRPEAQTGILVGGFILLMGSALPPCRSARGTWALSRSAASALMGACGDGWCRRSDSVDVRRAGASLILNSAPPNLVWALYTEGRDPCPVAATAVSGCLPKATLRHHPRLELTSYDACQ